MKKHNPLFLIILDGFGIAPPSKSNAVSLAKTPTLDELIGRYPHATLQAAGEAVGLPWHNMGNSEVGHMNFGSGRIMYQDLPKINKTIQEGGFFENEAFGKAISHVLKNKSDLHLMGLLTNGGVHAHVFHLYALLELLKKKKVKNVFLHLFLDGRDMKKDSAIDLIADLENKIKTLKIGKIATICGRFYAMDRNQRWDLTKKAYDLLTLGKGVKTANLRKSILASYKRKVFDEAFYPTVNIKNGRPIAKINDNDGIIFFNFRCDRALQLTKSFVLPGFDKFNRQRRLNNVYFVTFTPYAFNLPVEVAFPASKVKNSINQLFVKNKIRQLRIAETEKYAHVTVFFNCGISKLSSFEERVLVPSKNVPAYDLTPEMSAKEITKKTVNQFLKKNYDFACVNYANPDMVGHTGNLTATVKAIEIVDKCLNDLVKFVLGKKGTLIVVSDHGNAETMKDPITGEINKEHTANPVPFILINDKMKSRKNDRLSHRDLFSAAPIGVLSDVSPTILELLEIDQPEEMTGISLLKILY